MSGASLPRVLLVGPLPPPPFRGGVEKGVGMLLRTSLARETGMRLFNNFRRRDPGRPLSARLRYQAGMVRSFRAELRRVPTDLVHVKTSSGINFHQNSLYVHAARLAGFPVLLQVHCGKFEAFARSSPPALRAWIRYTLRRADRVAVLSPSWERRIATLAPGTRLEVVPNGLEPEELRLLGGPGVRRRDQVLFMGTGEAGLNREKGLEDLLEVVPRLAGDYPAFRWILAGLESPAEAEQWWHSRGIPRPPAERVVLRGVVDGEERIRLLKESSLLVLPSYFENMPNLVLEAMAAGEAVAASRVGAVPEMLDPEAGEFLFPPGDAEALGAALRRALEVGPRLSELGARNREAVSRRYTLSVVEERLKEIYRALAGPPATAATTDSDPAAAASAPGPTRDVAPLRPPVGSR